MPICRRWFRSSVSREGDTNPGAGGCLANSIEVDRLIFGLHQVIRFANELHVAVFDAVVDHLDVVAGPARADPFAAGDVAVRADLGGDGLEDGLDQRPGFFAPAGIPDSVLRRLNGAAVEALKTPDLSSKLRASGFEPAPTTPEQFREFIRGESAKFARIIVEADIKLEQ